MSPEVWLTLLRQQRAIAVIRSSSLELGRKMAHAAVAAQFRLVEITWNSAQAAELVAGLRQELPDVLIGVGTILDISMLEKAIEAGAQFVFCPHVEAALIQPLVEQQIPVIPGALTPTEILSAWQLSGYGVKLFPANAVGGAAYVQSLQGPLGHVSLIPTGGVTLDNARAFIHAGAIAVGLSSDLFPRQLVEPQNWSLITTRANALLQSLQQPLL